MAWNMIRNMSLDKVVAPTALNVMFRLPTAGAVGYAVPSLTGLGRAPLMIKPLVTS